MQRNPSTISSKFQTLFSSKSDAWTTPQWFFDALDAEFGFEVDVCASPQHAKCAVYYSPEVDGLKQLELVKLTQENWVKAGTVVERCAQPWLHHNVSNTISITPEQQELAAKYIYENRHSFAGVSILSTTGDLDYVQAPFCEVRYTDELLADYGDGVFFASGLIVDGLHAFGNNLCPSGTGSFYH